MIIVPGSVNADLLFKVQRLPRPGETVLCPGYVFAPGGKGANQAAAAAKAGAEVRFVGHVGDDAYGPIVRGLLEEAGVDCSLLAISRQPTAIAVIGVDEAGENAIIVGSGANLDTNAAQIPGSLLHEGNTVLCQNEIKPEATFQALRRARKGGARAMLNLAPAGAVPAEVLDDLDVLVVNEIEAEMLTGGTGASPVDLARMLAGRHDLVCVVTLGAAGAIGIGRGAGWRVSALRITPVDTTGAGDTFVGVLASWLDRGAVLAEALRAASVGAALACEAMGAQTAQPTRQRIEARLGDLAPAQPV